MATQDELRETPMTPRPHRKRARVSELPVSEPLVRAQDYRFDFLSRYGGLVRTALTAYISLEEAVYNFNLLLEDEGKGTEIHINWGGTTIEDFLEQYGDLVTSE